VGGTVSDGGKEAVPEIRVRKKKAVMIVHAR
jgi:hypothetical protein